MLRESTGDNSITVESLEEDDHHGIPLGGEMVAFVRAVCRNDAEEIARTREVLLQVGGPEVVVDVAGVIADFQALTRIADATGTELDERFRI